MAQPTSSGAGHTIDDIPDRESKSSAFSEKTLTDPKHGAALDSQLQDQQTQQIIEMVTHVEVARSRKPTLAAEEDRQSSNDVKIMSEQRTSMILRSKALLNMVKNVVKWDPSQMLTGLLSGKIVMIHEPYTTLLHHVEAFEELRTVLENESTKSGQAIDSLKLQHLDVLLGILRPKYRTLCLPAQTRLLQTHPTVMFEDIWLLLRPGSRAYIHLNGQWLGCIIQKTVKSQIDASGTAPAKWSINVCLLQMSRASGNLESVFLNTFIEYFGGEKIVTSLSIFPSHFHDRADDSARRDRFEKRGEEIARMLLEGPRHMSYEGACLDNACHLYNGQIVIDGRHGVTALLPAHGWNFDDGSTKPFGRMTQILGLVTRDGLTHPSSERLSLEDLSQDHFFILSPCLQAFGVTSQSWMLVDAERVRELEIPEFIPDPLLEPDKLAILTATREWNNHSTSRYEPLRYPKNPKLTGQGPSGVGKVSTVETICLQVRRPLLALTVDSTRSVAEEYDNQHEATKQWIALGERWNAIFCIIEEEKDDTNMLFHGIHLMRGCFTGIVFLIARRLDDIDTWVRSSIHLMIKFDDLNDSKRKAIWKGLQEKLEGEQKNKVRLSSSASNLLDYNEIHYLKWDGHKIAQCFRTAVALAEVDSREGPLFTDGETIVVDAEHFKDAINLTSSRYNDESQERFSTFRNNLPPVPDNNDKPRNADPQPMPKLVEEPGNANPKPIRSDTDITLCIAQLNHVEWEDFKAAASNELFRKAKFYAIDVLVKEPRVRLVQVNKKSTRRRIPLKSNGPDQIALEPTRGETGNDWANLLPGQAPLPERIRINSTLILNVLRDIFDDEGVESKSPMIMFRPYRSLMYFEQDIREWIARQEAKLQAQATQEAEEINPGGELDMKDALETNESDDKTYLDREKAALENMRCLLAVIDQYIRPKQEFMKSPVCHTVTFTDLWYLFTAGDTVVNRDTGQAYRVIEVKTVGHGIRTSHEATPELWRDDGTAITEDNPLHVICVYVDFDGTTIGPVSLEISIAHFHGTKAVSSFLIYPLRFAKNPELGDKLIQRGKLFVEVAKIKHMHYSGLTLGTHDEVESQVMIDFEEAIAWNRRWRPQITSAKTDYQIPPSRFRMCVDECCRNESTHDDEHVEARLRHEFVTSRMNYSTHTKPSVAIVPQALKQITGANSIDDDDYMVMSYRVFGFVLRNRKWAQLDLENLTEVTVLGEERGFDQLVLPPGHKDMLKSMIRQHFRDKSFMRDERNQPDVVRGKGRGLIMLLHGVPGVGKTSTAECVADSFRRPLFQITSGDLGTKARKVEAALETNFALANRWNCILLIDEADVFLAERTKEDFVRNSLVAVFLRIMEYYAGVLFLTTNRVGVFDEAFTSRIHISLYYPPLERDPTHKIFEMNMERLKARYDSNSRKVEIRESEITKFALDYYDNNKQGRWNGRQIRNAFQSAIALAELEANESNDATIEPDQDQPVILRGKHFETVAGAYKGFTDYLSQIYGADFGRRARENLWRSDTFGTPKVNALTTRLKVADPRPAPEPWHQPPYPNYTYNSSPQPPYPQPPAHHEIREKEHRTLQRGVLILGSDRVLWIKGQVVRTLDDLALVIIHTREIRQLNS